MDTNAEREAGHLSTDQRDDRIRRIAYSIWEEEGCPEGCADDHWHRATAIYEAQLGVEQMRDPDWLKRDDGAAEAPAEKSADTVAPRQGRRAAA